jgi:hypothetical protein
MTLLWSLAICITNRNFYAIAIRAMRSTSSGNVGRPLSALPCPIASNVFRCDLCSFWCFTNAILFHQMGDGSSVPPMYFAYRLSSVRIPLTSSNRQALL